MTPTNQADSTDSSGRHKPPEETLQKMLRESRERQAEIAALLKASQAILEYREFPDAARAIFDSCKMLIGATSGYVALLSKDGTENELLFLDSGGLPCTVDPSLPMPIRGLRGKAYQSGKAVFDNAFSQSNWTRFLPEGHVKLENVLFAPLRVDGEVVGLLGIANKPGGFTDRDARMASAFGELAAISLQNSRALEALESSEQRFRSLTQSAGDGIISADTSGNVVYWNRAAEKMFGYSAREITGKPLTVIMPERFHQAHRNGMSRVISTGKSTVIGKTVEVVGLRSDGSQFPVELSTATWKTKEGTFFTGILRDVSTRKQAEEEIARLAKFPDENPNPVLRVSGEGTVLYANRSSYPLLDVWRCRQGGRLPDDWRRVLHDGLGAQPSYRTELKCGERVFSLTFAPVADSSHVNVYGLDITERKQAEEAVRRAREELEIRVVQRTAELAKANQALQAEITQRKKLEKEVLEISTQEQRRIGQELHDRLGQELTGLSYLAKSLLQRLQAKGLKEAQTAADLARGIPHALGQVQTIVKGLVPLEIGLEDLVLPLRALTANLEERTGISCRLEGDRPVQIGDSNSAVQLYHIAQEAVTNAVKHAEARHIVVTLKADPSQIVLEVRDDGVGIPPDAEKASGSGLQIMRYRARAIGGALDVQQPTGGGTLVTCTLPQG